MTLSPTELRDHFRTLHTAGCFVLPNPFDVGSAKLLASMGFRAIATTSAGLAASLGKHDQHLTRDELVAHVASLASAVDIPINADSERLYSNDLAGIATTVDLLADAGVSGCSIEDYDPAKRAIDPIDVAAARVAAAAQACARHGIVLTARAEAHLYGTADLDDTIARLQAYHEAGAEVVYAPGLTDLTVIRQVVEAIGAPVNVLAFPNGPSVAELESVGVRRVSTGGALAWAAYGAFARGADELLRSGTSEYARNGLPRSSRSAFD